MKKHIIILEKLRDIKGDWKMGNIINSKLFHSIILFTVIGEFFLPWILEQFYAEYDGKIMVMSATTVKQWQ